MHRLAMLVALGGCSLVGARVHRPVPADASCTSVLPKIDLAAAIALALPIVLIQLDSDCVDNCNFDSKQLLTYTVGLPTLVASLVTFASAAHGAEVNETCRRERAIARSRR